VEIREPAGSFQETGRRSPNQTQGDGYDRMFGC
jgi:hypothetical protein